MWKYFIFIEMTIIILNTTQSTEKMWMFSSKTFIPMKDGK